MCGFFGWIRRSRSAQFDRSTALSIADRLSARGPDDEGFLVSDERGAIVTGRRHDMAWPEVVSLNLIHRRLSIIDLSEAGWQPYGSAPGPYLVFNGEIFNYIELRAELQGLGVKFSSQSDTEVLFQCLKVWGRECLAKLRGMFAFAWFDSDEGSVLLARDQLGIKPLYITEQDGYIAFGSEITALAALPGQDLSLNRDALFFFLRWGRATVGSETLFSSIRRLPPGSYLKLCSESGCALDEGVFYVPGKDSPSLATGSDQTEYLRSLLQTSMTLHLRSDVPVGVALSGGVDSTALVGLYRQQKPDEEIHAFSYSAHGSSADESAIVAKTAKEHGLMLHCVSVDTGSFLRRAKEVAVAVDEPFGSTSVLAEHQVFEAARAEGVLVVFSGQGPDECFGGYSKYRTAAVADAFRQSGPGPGFSRLKSLSGYPDTSGLNGLAQVGRYLAPDFLNRAVRNMAGKPILPPQLKSAYFGSSSRDFMQDVELKGAEQNRGGFVKSMQWHDMFDVSLPGLLARADSTSMAHSVEGRVPYVLPEIADFALSLSVSDMIAPDGVTKKVFRDAVSDVVRRDVLDVRRKVGFETQEEQWMELIRAELVGLEDSKHGVLSEFIDLEQVLNDIKGQAPLNRTHWRILILWWWLQARGLH
jgi:asparagine synthase (glutamine-hydrolysing)